jgi:hypothetical protein
MPTPLLLELVGEGFSAKGEDVFEDACVAVTRCVLVPVRAANSEENCSALVSKKSFAYEQTLDGIDTVRLMVEGVDVSPEFLFEDEVRACCALHLKGFQVERLALDTDESASFALDAMAALLCLVMVVLAVKWYRRS